MSNPGPPVVAKHASARVRSGASRADPGPLPPGATTQEFEIVSVIGQGGFGIVYLARDRALQRLVAVKEYMPAQLAGRGRDGIVLALNPAQADVFERGRRSFINEARMLARFSQRGLVEVLRFWEQNGTAYMAMRYYDGATLADYLRRHPGVATEAWLRRVLGPVIDALAAMHAEGCCHRDVSPDNILILKDGGAVLLDLGAARQVIADEKQAMTVMLKPGFAPIEQYADDPRFQQGSWTDVYALAAVLYYCVAGKAPPASAARVMHDNAMTLSAGSYGAFSTGFLRAIDRGLALRPEERPATMAKFRSMLDDAATAKLCGNDDSGVGAVGSRPRTGPGRSRPLAGHRRLARSQPSSADAAAAPRRAWRGRAVAGGIAVVLGLAVLGGWSRSEPMPPIAGPQLIAATAAAMPSSTVDPWVCRRHRGRSGCQHRYTPCADRAVADRCPGPGDTD